MSWFVRIEFREGELVWASCGSENAAYLLVESLSTDVCVHIIQASSLEEAIEEHRELSEENRVNQL